MKLREMHEVVVGLSALADPESCGDDNNWKPNQRDLELRLAEQKIQDGQQQKNRQNVRHLKAEDEESFLKAFADRLTS